MVYRTVKWKKNIIWAPSMSSGFTRNCKELLLQKEKRGGKKGKEKNDLLILVLKARLGFKPWAEVHVSSLSKPVHLLLVISSLLSRRRELLCSQREESSQLKNTKELAPAGSSSWKIFFASIWDFTDTFHWNLFSIFFFNASLRF